MKVNISIVSILLISIVLSQNLRGQNSIEIKGYVSFYDKNEIVPGANIEIFHKNELVENTNTDLENGTFNFISTNKIDKIVFSFPYCYSTIIENINNHKRSVLDLNQIKLYTIPSTFTRYATEEAERQDRKESKQKFRKLKKGIIINSGNKKHLMKLKKKKGKYAFYINFHDFQN